MRTILLFTLLISSISGLFAQLPSYIPSNGLVAYYPFNGTANDESVNGNHGTINGVTSTTDRDSVTGSAFYFDGSSYINIPNSSSLQFNGGISLSIWINPSALQSPTNYVLSKGWDNPKYAWTFDISPTGGEGLRFWTNTSAGAKLPHTSPVQVNKWKHFLYTCDGSTWKLYINGILDTSRNFSFTDFSNTYDLKIGRMGHSSGNWPYYFTGKMDDLAIWNRALSEQEVKEVYNACTLSVATHPGNQTAAQGQAVSFTAKASDNTAAYKWQTDLGVGFQNINNAGQYSGANDDTLKVSALTLANHNQKFRCIITSGLCADTTNAVTLEILPTGISKVKPLKTFELYPNPCKGNFYIRRGAAENISFYLLDATGRILYQGQTSGETTMVEAGYLPAGFYILQMEGYNAKHLIIYK